MSNIFGLKKILAPPASEKGEADTDEASFCTSHHQSTYLFTRHHEKGFFRKMKNFTELWLLVETTRHSRFRANDDVFPEVQKSGNFNSLI
jgi:hypothetical protein